MKRAVFAALLGCLALQAQTAGKIQINLGTVAPEGSPWHTVLLKMREDWAKASGGNVNIRIYAGGTQGDELELVRKVRIGQLHALGLSGVGLSTIEPGVQGLAIPMLLDSYEEFDYVRERLAPKLEALLEQKGFVVLQWSDVGWVRFFSKTPARMPDDMRRLKLFTSAGDPKAEALYKDFGMKVVPLAVTDMLTSLKTGMIEAFDVPPLFAMLDQSFGVANHMLELNWAPLAGATLIHKRVWDRIPAQQRSELLKLARTAAESKRAAIRKMGDDAVVEMKKRGLKVIPVDAAAMAKWRAEAERSYPKMRGEIVPPPIFDEALRLRNEFRARHNKK